MITPHDTLGGELGRWWPRLIQWQRRLEAGGLGGDQLLGQTRHDIQTVHTYPLEAGHLLVLAADRAGGWYAGRFETSTGAPVGQPWRAMPIPVAGDGDRLRITQALVTPWGRDHLIWLGTSRHGLWTVPLGALLSSSGGASEHDTRLQDSEPSSLTGGEDPGGQIFTPVDGLSQGPARHLIYDRAAESVIAAGGAVLGCWALGDGRASPRLLWRQITSGAEITGLALEQHARGDLLYVATDEGLVLNAPRQGAGTFARPEIMSLGAEGCLWSCPGARPRLLQPLSAHRDHGPAGAGGPRYAARGVTLINDQEIVLIAEGPEGPMRHQRAVSDGAPITALAAISVASWRGLLICQGDGGARLLWADGGDARYRAPHPANLLNGDQPVSSPPGRIEAACPLDARAESDGFEACPIVVGGERAVRLLWFIPPPSLEAAFEEGAQRLARRVPPDLLLDQLTRLTLNGGLAPRDVTALARLLPAVGRRCDDAALWRRLVLWVWDLLAHQRRAPAILPLTITGLRRLARDRPDRAADLASLQGQIRRGVQDTGPLTGPRPRSLERLHASAGDADGEAIERSILISRRTDLLFQRRFEPEERFGEIRAMLALPGPRRRLLVATWRRGLWLFDDRGAGARLTGQDDQWGPIYAMHLRSEDVILAFADGALRVAGLAALEAAWHTPGHRLELPALRRGPALPAQIRAMCAVPGARVDDLRCLSGDVAGRIYLETAAGRRGLVELGQGRDLARITDLCSGSVTYTCAEGRRRRWPFVVAGTTSGHLYLMRWCGDREALIVVDQTRAGVAPITCLSYPAPERRMLVISTADGQILGYPVGPEIPHEAREGGPWRLRARWAWQAEDAVRCVQGLRLDDGRGPPLIFAGSHSGHLHVLDLAGRLLESYRLDGVKVDRFVVTRPASEDGDRVDARVYLCAFENEIQGLRLLARRKLLVDLQRQVEAAEDRELALSRWRAFALYEGHLRHRFIRQSHRFPSADPAQMISATLDALARAARSADHGEYATGRVAALIRRLFQNAEPGAAPGAAASGAAQGMAALVADPPLYLKAMTALQSLAQRWSTPGSQESRRVQLHWIRATLRNVDTPEILYRWLEVGEATAGSGIRVRPEDVIGHCLSHASGLVQRKTLQYLERLLFDWPGVERRGLLIQAGPTCRRTRGLLIRVLLRRLALDLEPIDVDDPQPATLMCGRMLCMLVAWGRLHPVALVHHVRYSGAPDSLYAVLAEQARALAWSSDLRGPRRRDAAAERLSRAAAVLQAAHRLSEILDGRGEDGALVACLTEMQRHLDEDPHDSANLDHASLDHASLDHACLDAHRRWLARYLPMMQVESLEAVVELPPAIAEAVEDAAAEGRADASPLPDLSTFAWMGPTLAAVAHYRTQKWADFVSPPMTSLAHRDFAEVLSQWRRAKSLVLQEGGGDLIGRALWRRLVARWDRIINEEQQQALLHDLMTIVELHCLRVPAEIPANGLEAVARLAEEGRMTRAAFTNLFTRLLLFAEPERGVFLHRGPESRTVEGLIYGEAVQVLRDDTAPPWLPAAWLRPLSFTALDEPQIHDALRAACPEITWEITAIAGITDEPGLFGYYIFGWPGEGSPGLARFRAHRMTRSILLEALVLRQASLEHQAMRGRLFSIVAHNLGAPLYHMRSDLKVLLDGFLDHDLERRREKYRELLHQARYMDGIIDGILSLSDRQIEVQRAEVDLGELTHEVVRTQRKAARVRHIEIDYARPAAALAARCVVQTDGDKVYDILLNVIGNAVKYSPASSRVTVAVVPAAQGVSVQITDRGLGIPPEERGLVFEPFYRGHRAIAEGKPGLGLGLYVARLYAESLEGRVQIAGEPEEGTSITLYLPRV